MSWRADETRQPTRSQRLRAGRLRREATEPEKRLWWHLRHRLPLPATHFRRQVPIGPYVADFCCLSARLVIELDGSQHGFGDEQARDRRRTAFLNQQGFRVLRFWNHEVMRGIETVLHTIADACRETPTPVGRFASARPSPQGGGKETL